MDNDSAPGPWEDQPLATPGESGSPSDGGGRGEWSGDPRRSGVILLAMAAVVALVLGYFFLRGNQPDASNDATPSGVGSAEAPVTPATRQPEAPVPATRVDLPPLGESDGLVRDLLAARKLGSLAGGWLGESELVRKFVAAVDNVAHGINPVKHVRFLKPKERFSAAKRSGQPLMGPASYARFDPMMAVIASVPPAAAVELYHQLEPLLEQAHRELGYGPDKSFRTTLERAMEQVLAVPVIEGPVPLTARFSSYRYADPSLESLNDAQKLFLRLGPKHLRSLQSKLRQCRNRL